MKIIAYLLAGLVATVGFITMYGWQGQISRLIIGIVLIAAGFVIVYMARLQPRAGITKTIQQIDLSGDVKLEDIRCKSCNAPLSKDEIDVEAGAILVSCSHCGATYQFEEEPKW